MAARAAIRFEDVSKRYLIERAAPRDGATPGKRSRKTISEEVWALRDVTFEVAQGEVFGIMGANGSGKSTLLKILSKVVRPTRGHVGINGRVTSLLEVGTGFHPELTGRENVFLNGAILGLSTAEIRRRFDAIVAFAEVERYIDTPVKRYSSGMYVRLAFSIAAHLDFEVMVVDEVLAVGDARFRERCLDLIERIARDEQRTVIFVSHDLSQIRRLAQRALLLEAGRVTCIDTAHRVISRYLRGDETTGDRPDDAARLALHDAAGDVVHSVACGEPCVFVIDIGAVPPDAQAELSFFDLEGTCMASLYTGLAVGPDPLVCAIQAMTLRPGDYRAEVTLFVHGKTLLAHYELGAFEVVEPLSGSHFQSGRGMLALETRWDRSYFP